jgi:hypothetical protein
LLLNRDCESSDLQRRSSINQLEWQGLCGKGGYGVLYVYSSAKVVGTGCCTSCPLKVLATYRETGTIDVSFGLSLNSVSGSSQMIPHCRSCLITRRRNINNNASVQSQPVYSTPLEQGLFSYKCNLSFFNPFSHPPLCNTSGRET